MKGLILTYSLTTLLAYSLLYAGVGTTGAQFLKIGPSARALGMAGAFGAVSDDVYALHFNPAGLAQLSQEELTATYLKYFADVNYGFIGYARPNTKIGIIGFGWTYLIVDKIEKRDVNETLLGTFNAKDHALTFAYAKHNAFPKLLEGLNIGGNLRLISSEIDQVIAYTAAADLSALYSPTEKLKTAVAVQNISWGIKFKDKTDPLPLNLKLAAAYQSLSNLTVACDIDTYIIDTKFYTAVGVEYSPVKQLMLRTGYKYGYDTASLGSLVGLAGGIGFRMWNLALDYAFLPFGTLGDTHRITFSAKF